jgi:nucleoside-diphosphate-sugar epimerase
MTTTAQGLTLVTGGTGKTGRRVAERLAARGLPVRIGSRAGVLVLLSGRGEPEAQAAEREVAAAAAATGVWAR